MSASRRAIARAYASAPAGCSTRRTPATLPPRRPSSRAPPPPSPRSRRRTSTTSSSCRSCSPGRDRVFHTRHIVAGHYLGFALLVAASLAAGAGLLALPDEAVGALGLVPLALGAHGLWRLRRGDPNGGETATVRADHMSTRSVAAVTVANGADNVAIYAPLFATVGSAGLTATLLVFFALVAVWCLAGLLIGSRPTAVRLVARAGHRAIPVVLIALGLFIVAESGILGSIV